MPFYHLFKWGEVQFTLISYLLNVKNNIFKIYSFINLMYNNHHVQYLKTVPCKGAADALLWFKDFLDKKMQCAIFLPYS